MTDYLEQFESFGDEISPKPYRGGFEPLSPRHSFRDQHSPLDFGALKSPITTGIAHKPPHCDTPAETRNSLSRPVCLQTSRLREFSMVLVSD